MPTKYETAIDELMKFIRSIPARTKHGPSGSGREGPCDADCVKCRATVMLAEVQALKDRPPMACMTCEEHNMKLADELNALGRWREDANDARRSIAFNTWMEASGANEWDPKDEEAAKAWMNGTLPKQKEEAEKFKKWWDEYENKFFL